MKRWPVVLFLVISTQAFADGGPDSVRICGPTGCTYSMAVDVHYVPKTHRVEVVAGKKFAVTPGIRSSGPGLMMIAEARKYTGMTGQQLGVRHRGLWCGEFMERVARASGGKVPSGYAKAASWIAAGYRVSGPQVGAIALVSGRKGIRHVGLVTGINSNGDPIIISGNHLNRVVETAYPKGRVSYVWPG